jgi:hypothetical protein
MAMKRKVSLISCFMFFILILNAQDFSKQESGRMKLLSNNFVFEETEMHKSFLNSENTKDSFFADAKSENGFTLKFTVNITDYNEDQTILEIPGIVTVRLRQADPNNRDRQNYPAFKMQDGSLPVMEASILLHAPIEKTFKQEMSIGFPIAMLSEPKGEHEIVLNFTGSKWTMYADNQLVDNDFPIGYPSWGRENSWNINTEFVKNAKIFFPAIKAIRDLSKESYVSPDVQYWTPPGHNSWVGDVATLYYKGRYHVFYLFDRRHHASKFGVGGHYFEHFSTADFKTWTEHEAATPIEEQWETFGTGTPFVYDDQLCISYGLHTSRIYPDEMTMTPVQIDYFKKHGKTGAFKFNFKEGYPSGATYSVSPNGLTDFQKSKIMFHYSENPSVYIDPDENLRMNANYRSKGTWESKTIDGDWYCINENFPPGGDCTFYFRWGKFDYIIGGFVNLWKKPVGVPDSEYRDIVNDGLDFYNGIGVPSVAEIQDGRFIMAGWFPIHGWGGPFVIHEMLQYPDGRIGTKWMKEIVPETENTRLLANKINEDSSFTLQDESFMLTFEVHPGKKTKAKLGISFLTQGQENDGCEFQISADEAIAQYSNARKNTFAEREKSLRQGGAPHSVGNYAIENLIGVDKPFSVRIIVKNNPKLGGSIIDTEIAGQRTMITYRPDLDIKKLKIRTDEIELKNLMLSKIK